MISFYLLLYLSFLSLFGVSRALDYIGADFSSLIDLENDGTTYTFDGTESAFETILAENGANLARIRIWTSDEYTEYSLDYGLALAKRAVDAGMALLIDLHYSDTWADPSDQAIPSGWSDSLDSLNTEIYNYTMEVVAAFSAQGTPIDYLQVGNEINSGILFPTGEISVNGYDPLSQLLNSAVSGAHTADSSVKIVVHLANGWDGSAMLSFYEQIFISGAFEEDDLDVMGFSFYPFYGDDATLDALESSLSELVSTYGKDIMVVETDWPISCSGVTLSDTSIPISAAGQVEWMSDIQSILEGLDDSHGIGLSYWEPGWIGNDDLGSSCADNLIVDDDGSVLSSVSMFSGSS
ncbi:arabinogalactan endo-1,4-beta-galactosidase [Fistulina hepatica ATCC 64428]|uniref:Arabinogalactan endo-beta-1,4-galactanase n=1 Tax=Fistulina hepatica ATCC 64428 TaxID=1128425 RepID=A0A0D7AB66_9AGAR|nr:arabinogalactan endo-1,4-beta-galactosidase [Fistulina hepatica ATCC 64428]